MNTPISFVLKGALALCLVSVLTGCNKETDTKSGPNTTSGASKEEPAVASAAPSPEPQQVQVTLPQVVNEKRADISTDISKFKFLGLTLGEPYTGKVGHNWKIGIDEDSELFRAEAKFLRPDDFKGAIFARMTAPDGLGEIGLLLSPRSKTILSLVLVKPILNQDISSVASLIRSTVNNCDKKFIDIFEADLLVYIDKLKKSETFSVGSDIGSQIEGSAGCEYILFADNLIENKRYFSEFYVGNGINRTFTSSDANWDKKLYKPSTIRFRFDDGIMVAAFANSSLTGGNPIKGSALFLKTGLSPIDVLNDDIAKLIEDGNPEVILEAAKSSTDSNDALRLLSRIEASNVEAKLLASKIYIYNNRSKEGSLQLDESDCYREAVARLKPLADSGNREAKLYLSEIYSSRTPYRDVQAAAKLIVESGDSVRLRNWCQSINTNVSLPECSEIMAQAAQRRAAEMSKMRVVASCRGPARRYIYTIMALGNNPMSMVSAIQAQSQFCSSINFPLDDPNIFSTIELVATGQNGAKFYVSRSNDENIMLGLIRQAD